LSSQILLNFMYLGWLEIPFQRLTEPAAEAIRNASLLHHFQVTVVIKACCAQGQEENRQSDAT